MLFNDLTTSDKYYESLHILSEQCSQFLEESRGLPLLKNLPKEYNDFHKVKVRKRQKNKEEDKTFVETFNDAFESETIYLRERSVFANGLASFEYMLEFDPFYVFPVDGFKFMYSIEVERSNQDYKAVFDDIFEEFGVDRGNEIISELLKFSYTSINLYEGIGQGSELILYNLPYFYAVRKSTVNDYTKMLTTIGDL